MEDDVRNIVDGRQAIATATPAVGFVATETNTDALVRSVARAQYNDFPCFVTYAGEHPPDGAVLAEYLDATVVAPYRSSASRESLEQVLVGAAQVNVSRGVILVPPDCPPIDFDRSEQAIEAAETDTVTAVPRAESHTRTSLDTLVVIPAYNEAATIDDVVTRALAYADEVLVVDDGSDDETAAVAREAGANVVEHERNRGYGASLKTAFRSARDRRADSLVILDGDGQHDPSDVPRLKDRLASSDADVVIGSRFVPGGDADLPLSRRVGMTVINLLTNLSMGAVRRDAWVNDTQSGFRAYGQAAIRSLASDDTISEDMGASTDILRHAREHDYHVAEVGTTMRYDVDNANSYGPVRHGLTLVSNILTTVERQHPITTLGVPGFVFTMLGFVLAYWSIVDYVSTGTLWVAVAVGTVFFSLAGILACFTALILHSLTVHFATDTERSSP